MSPPPRDRGPTAPEPAPRSISAPGLRPGHVAAWVAAWIAAGPEQAHRVLDLDLAPETIAALTRARDELAAAAARGAVYGRNTGVGALRHVRADPGAAPGEHARRLWRSHAAGLGPELDDATARATMLVRLHQLTRAGAGVDPALVSALAGALEAGAVPRLHAYGAVGTGDLAVLAELALALAGELPWRSGQGPIAPVADGDGLPFLSSNAMTVAAGSLAVVRLTALAEVAERIAALTHLALRGADQAYDSRVYLAKAEPFAGEVAARMRALLGDPGDRPRPARLQDPFGLRALPQVHAALAACTTDAESVLAAEIGAAAENPLVVEEAVLHHGQFLTQRLATALDAVRLAVQPVLSLSVGRLGSLLDPRLTGLPAFLADGAAGSSGLMILEYVASDLLARTDLLTTAASPHRSVVSLALEEHASHSTQSAWACREVVALVPDLLACELVAAVRALRMEPSRLGGSPAAELFGRADPLIPDVAGDHVLGPGLQAASDLVGRLAAEEARAQWDQEAQ